VSGPVKGKFAEASEATREAMLEAGKQILLNQPASGVFSHLTASRLATAANRTTGALFHQWPTLDDYLRDLIARVFDPSESDTLREVTAKIAEVTATGGTLAEGIVAGARHGLDVLPNDPHSIVEMLMWNRAARDREFRDMVGSLYPTLDAIGGSFIEAMLEASGREMRPPYTPEIFAALCAAVLQGLAVREVMTPDFYPANIAGHVLITLVPLFTRLPDDHTDADSFIDAIAIEATN
jgi:AcrR family transcriptional regulator